MLNKTHPSLPKKGSRSLSRYILALVLLPLISISTLLVIMNALERAGDNRRMLKEQRTMMVQMRQQGVRDVVQVARTSIQDVLARHATVTDAVREEAATVLRNLRFEGENYVFVVDFDGVTRVQPVAPAHEGKDNTAVQDAKGRYFIRDMVELARKGGGFYEYAWKNPRSGEVETKYSFAGSVPELGWMIGAGAYATDIDLAMADIEATAHADLRGALIRSVAISLAVLLVIAIAAAWLTRRMAARIEAAAGAIQEISEEVAQGRGDLTRRIPVSGRDEITVMAVQMNEFLARVQDILHEVRASVAVVDDASGTISHNSEELAARSEQAAANLQQTSSSLEEITATVQHSASSAVQANELALAASKVAEDGEASMLKAESTMGEILHASQQIAEIIKMIDTIAFQTNILALNASVEAARAGEHGRGFAVVAQEVRTLAERSRLAAQDIRGLIESTGEQIRHGESVVKQTAETMREIVTQINHVTTAVSEITQASREQSAGVVQINTAVAEMDTMTQQNSSMVQELTQAAGNMRSHALHLNGMLAGLVLDEGDRQASTATRRLLETVGLAGERPAHGAEDADAVARARQPARPALAKTEDDWDSF